ncbi:hypothetical protein BEI60_21325 [Eisenbergiella tayi]|nr:hypothetical protein BEI60_21325 [Eisenbergiella tayi]ODR38294.1 hypothetical protein BEI62_19175 [Eisenbergiella tayi]
MVSSSWYIKHLLTGYLSGQGRLLFLPGGKRGQRGHRTGPWGYGIGFKIWALPEIRAKPVFVWRGNV